MAVSLKETIADLVRPDIEAMGLELFDVEIAGASHAPVVRVFLERPGGGIDMDSIATASKAISALLDEKQPVSNRYTLEVSSPGLDRPLRNLADFARYVGRDAQVTLAEAVAGRKRFSGRIDRIDDGIVVMDVDGAGLTELPYASVAKARLKADIDFSCLERDEGTQQS